MPTAAALARLLHTPRERMCALDLSAWDSRLATWRTLSSGQNTHCTSGRGELRFVDASAIAEISVAAIGASTDLVCVCVTSGCDVADVLCSQNLVANTRPGAIVAIHSTLSPSSCPSFAAQATGLGIQLLDAPASGGDTEARHGRLLFMLGGAPDLIKTAIPTLSCFGNRLVRVGPVGAGQSAKIINNLLFLANFGAANQALALGRSLGLDATALQTALTQDSASSRALEAPSKLTSPEMAARTEPILAKDLNLARNLAQTSAIDIGALDQASVAALAHLSEILRPTPLNG